MLGARRHLKRRLAAHPRLYVNGHRASNLARYLARVPHEPDFAFYRDAAPRPGVFLDVGANKGQSALCFRMYDKRRRIVSIEANAALEDDLRFVARILRGFEYRIVAGGTEPGELVLHVPHYRGLAITGEASLERPRPQDVWWFEEQGISDPGRTFSVTEHRVPVLPLDDLGLQVAHLKIDVEGAELQVLDGLRETLRRDRPTVLVELSDAFGAIRERLAGLDYEPFVYDRAGRRLKSYAGQPAQNVFLLAPRDR